MAFNPDEYLKKKASISSQSGPTPTPLPPPDEATKQKWEESARESDRENLQTLGTVGGGMAGGLLGGPFGAVAGAGTGGAAGYQLGERLTGGDPTLKGTAIAAGEGALSEAGGQLAGKALGKTVGFLKNTKAGQYVAEQAGKGLEKVKNFAGKSLAKLGEAASGISSQDLQTYSKQMDEVDKLYEQAGGNVSEAADAVRKKVNDGIKKAKGLLNDQISNTLSQPDVNRPVNASSLIDALESSKSKLNKVTQKEAIAQIDEHINVIKELTDENGLTTAKDLFDIQNYLKQRSAPFYQKQGAIFNTAPESSKAANAAYSQSRKMISKEMPEIAKANQDLAKLHTIENRLNKNILKEGAPEGSLIAAGSGSNQRQQKLLQELGAQTGQDILNQVSLVSAGKNLYSPQLLPVDTTGKSAARVGALALIKPQLAPVASPMVQKGLIKAGKQTGKMAKKIAPKIPPALATGLLSEEIQDVGE